MKDLTKEDQILIIENLIQLAKDYAADEGANTDSDIEIKEAERLIEFINDRC